MGTSSSFRSPPVPRWQAFTAALATGQSIDRARSELFNAGNDWEQALSSKRIADYAAALLGVYESLPDQLRSGDRPESVLQAVVANVKSDRFVETGSSAEAMAERAFIRLLTRTSGGGASLTQLSSKQAADQFVADRGTPNRFVAEYIAELLGQYARHAADREIGRLAEIVPGTRLSEARRITRQIAEAAQQVGAQVRVGGVDDFSIRDQWASLVAEAFARGRQLPGSKA
jgi:hypothetical protein